jgi:hypothetical protein
MKNFSLNDNGTISLHYDNLNPAQVEELISTLQGNLWFMKSKKEDPIVVMKKSAKLSRARGELSFRLAWDAEEMLINLDDEFLPSPPNIDLSEDDLDRYHLTLKQMLSTI